MTLAALPMRSKLFVPGSRPELFAKALAGPADAISIDLEDAVLEERKAEARATTAAFLRSLGASVTKIVIVRINALSTPHAGADLDAVVGPGLAVVNVPKCESADDVRAAAGHIARVERERGLAASTGILANVESPRGLRRAAEIACADPRVVGLQLGLGDLFEPLGIDRTDVDAVRHVQLALRIAAGEAGVAAYDGAFANVADAEGFRAEALRARRLGFAGKSCIHPSQVAPANDVFRPGDAELAHARRVLEAWDDAQRRGLGAVLVDGEMIDRPFVVKAQAILAAAGGSR